MNDNGNNLNMSDALSRSDDIRQRQLMDELRSKLNPGKTDDQKLREAVQGFEAIFIKQIWQQMRATIPKDGMFHSKEEEFYQSMFDHELAKNMSESGGIGLGELLYAELKRRTDQTAVSTLPSRFQERPPVRSLQGEAPSVLPLNSKKDGLPLNPADLYEPLDEESADSGQDTEEAARTAQQQPAESFLSAAETNAPAAQLGRYAPTAATPDKKPMEFGPGIADPSVAARIEKPGKTAAPNFSGRPAGPVNGTSYASAYLNQSEAWRSASARPQSWGQSAAVSEDTLTLGPDAGKTEPVSEAVKKRVDNLASGIEAKLSGPSDG